MQLKTVLKANYKLMTRTRLTTRANYNRRKADYRRGRLRPRVKHIEVRIRNRDIKIKQIIPQSQNIEVKKWLLEND